MSITAQEWEEAMEYLYSLEDLLEAILKVERYLVWPDASVEPVLERAKAMKHAWYNREE